MRYEDGNDHKGDPIPKYETPNDLIWVYKIDPCLHDNGYDEVWIRSWQGMTSYIEDNVQLWADNFNDEDFKTGISLKISLIKIQKCDLPEEPPNEKD